MQDGCHPDIVIIQGDTSQTNVTIEGVTSDTIKDVYFSCGKLDLSRKLTYDSELDKYVLLFISAETAEFKPITANFDITIHMFDGTVITGLYRGKIIVTDKNNPVEVYSDDDIQK